MADPISLSYDDFVSTHSNQLLSSDVPQKFWPTLYRKLITETFDAGIDFRIEKIVFEDTIDVDVINGDYEQQDGNDDNVDDSHQTYRVICIKEDGIEVNGQTSDGIYLIDHMITYRTEEICNILIQSNGLIERLCNLFEMSCDADIDNNLELKQVIARRVAKELWKWNQSYSIESQEVENSLPVWYLMDEFGSRIGHSFEANCRCVPFYFIPQRIAYSLLFAKSNISFEEEVTRNYIEGSLNEEFTEHKDLLSKALMIPWIYDDLSQVDSNQTEPDIAFIRRGRVEESIVDSNAMVLPKLPENRKLKVYSQYKYINSYLTNKSFEMTDHLSDADILWLSTHFKEFRELHNEKSNVFINQFPFEHIITVKDLFAIVCRRKNSSDSVDENTLETSPEWLATTYNLQTEIVKFVAYFQKRAKRHLNNLWIIKPWNLARSLDTVITDDLNCIIRLRNTIPKVVCKYITEPVLFQRSDLNNALVKFDIRYIVLLRSISPLEVYVYKYFWLRFSNKAFSLDNFDDYEKHFTVMNYKVRPEGDLTPDNQQNNSQFKQIYCKDFIQEFNKQYEPDYDWNTIEKDIYKTLKIAFECATLRPPPHGIGDNPQSRALYGVDIMLKWKTDSQTKRRYIQPVLLEMNWAPDCQRACLYYNHFFNDIFSTLFLKDFNTKENNVILL
ncbi:tubulin--tyrosine ligase-like protein 12 [Oppia nitens]|uniref:tubulin--tyrosine ligase-like protein 12 n=1 Tax=Oppia nitens TaxID=1686743 RepID=UPI0023DBABF9|nr:tubulin--tyrosine ligase-like protein 12 [Oppia nitens]